MTAIGGGAAVVGGVSSRPELTESIRHQNWGHGETASVDDHTIRDGTEKTIASSIFGDCAKTLLARYGATMGNVVGKALYVTDMGEAFKVASTILVTPRLAFREQLVEIKLTAKV